jgi:hypothetical protein
MLQLIIVLQLVSLFKSLILKMLASQNLVTFRDI